MRAFRISALVLVGAACGASEHGEVVSISTHAVAVRACRLYDEPASICRGAPEETAPLVEEAGDSVERWPHPS